jgi:hypothetical protein
VLEVLVTPEFEGYKKVFSKMTTGNRKLSKKFQGFKKGIGKSQKWQGKAQDFGRGLKGKYMGALKMG